MAEITITQANFKETVLESELPVLVDFWATWCGPCRMQAPILEELAADMEGKAVIGKVNVDEEPVLASMYDVSAIPTLICFKKGEAVAKRVGLQNKIDLKGLLQG